MNKGTAKKSKENSESNLISDLDLSVCDVGGIEVPDIDVSLIDFIASDETEETRYIKPKIVHMQSEQVMYDNAVEMAKSIDITEGERIDAFVSGNFIFGDFIEAFLTTKNARAKEITVSTLSLSQNNIDSFAELLKNDFIGKLNLIVSVYFWANERHNLIPYIYRELDRDDRFQLAIADIHTKTVHFETMGGKKIVIHGSANLRSSGNIEQFTIEENKQLFDFYDEKFRMIVDKYATIKHGIRANQAWDCITRKKF